MSAGDPPPLDVVVVGAGISGLTAAFRLARAGMRVAVLEAGGARGRRDRDPSEGPWRFEMGPNTVVEDDASVGALVARCRARRREDRRPRRPRSGATSGKAAGWCRCPAGPAGFLATPLFPLGAKLRLLREPWIGGPPAGRRRGVDRRVRPPPAGPDLPRLRRRPVRLRRLRRRPRAARRALGGAEDRRAGARAREPDPRRAGARRQGGRRRAAPMISFRDGLEALPRRARRRRSATSAPASCLHGAGTGTPGGASASRPRPARSTARRVVLAVPADVGRPAPRRGYGRSEPRSSPRSPTPPVAVVAARLPARARSPIPLDGFGFLAPRNEGLRLLGCLFPSTIFPGRAPEGHVALVRLPRRPHRPRDRAALGRRAAPRPGRRRARPRPRAARRARRPHRPPLAAGHSPIRDRPRPLRRSRRARSSATCPASTSAATSSSGVSVPDCVANATALAERILGERG